jgi:DNA-binding NarL/FixJ family response regulator
VCAKAIEAGADGFIVKGAIATDLMPGMDAVMDGEQYVSPSVPRPKAPDGERLTQ